MYCTCGECLQHAKQTQLLNQERFDNLSMRQTWQLRDAEEIPSSEDCLIKANKHHFTSILQRFQESETYRKFQLAHNRDEEHCKERDKFALENHSYVATPADRKRHESNWTLRLNTQGHVGNKRQRADYLDAVRRFQELRTQEGDEHVVIPPIEQQRQGAHHTFMRGE